MEKWWERPALALAFCFLSMGMGEAAQAAAWTQGKGITQLIFTLSGYQADAYYARDKHAYLSNEVFRKTEFNPYIEYGLSDDLTVGISPSIQHWEFLSQSGQQQARFDFRQCDGAQMTETVDIAEAELFLRKRVYQEGNLTVSLQPLLKTPCFIRQEEGWHVLHHTAAWEMRALMGYSFKAPEWLQEPNRVYAGQYHFVNMEMAYRERPRQFSDQVKLEGTIGIRPNEDWLVLGQVFSVFATENEPVAVLPGGGIEEDKYGAVKLQLSTVRQLREDVALQMGGTYDVWGRNSGRGVGVLMSIWYNF